MFWCFCYATYNVAFSLEITKQKQFVYFLQKYEINNNFMIYEHVFTVVTVAIVMRVSVPLKSWHLKKFPKYFPHFSWLKLVSASVQFSNNVGKVAIIRCFNLKIGIN